MTNVNQFKRENYIYNGLIYVQNNEWKTNI